MSEEFDRLVSNAARDQVRAIDQAVFEHWATTGHKNMTLMPSGWACWDCRTSHVYEIKVVGE